MRIKTAFILCAGFGKRLNPLTLNKPKPLLEVNDLTLLENTINIIKSLEIKKIKLNTFYLKEKINEFIRKKNFDIDIEIIDDGDQILDTGGGILNMIKSSSKSEFDFLVFNPDTIWDLSYIKTIKEMENFYFTNKILNILMVVNKNLSFDPNLTGDFSLSNNNLIKKDINHYIYTGCQIINKKIFDPNIAVKKKKFPILNLWNSLIEKNSLFGYENKNILNHVTDLDIYLKLSKN
jgi:MurNAc alpha-1-phosphate uridylyltransferase